MATGQIAFFVHISLWRSKSEVKSPTKKRQIWHSVIINLLISLYLVEGRNSYAAWIALSFY